ncbi:hypothetical protein [Pseudokineococcus sp. 1T1Z-3]|uniref:hypothetical protein n=1 Tax=Pseudokineococcus sp. 1T1Z-3 TaxID=3132745 RepID=UPI0030A0801F
MEGIYSTSYTEVGQQELADGSRVVFVQGELSDGSSYRSFLQIVRTDNGSVRAVDPVFWFAREFDSA